MAKRVKKKEHSGFFGLKIDIPSFEKMAGRKRSLKSKEHPITDLGQLKRSRLLKFAKSGSLVTLEGLLEHKGSGILSVDVPKITSDAYSGQTSGKIVTPFTVLTSYVFHQPEKRKTAKSFVVIWKHERELPPELTAEAPEKKLKYVVQFLDHLSEMDKARIPPDIGRIANMETLLSELKDKRKDYNIDRKILDLNQIKDHTELFRAVQNLDMVDFHHKELVGESRYTTVDRFGKLKGKFRKSTSLERKLLRNLGIKPTEYVFELVERPMENPNTSPVDLLKKFRAR